MKKLLTPRKKIAWLLLSVMGIHCLLPTAVYALTSGPSQPEVQSFEPVGTTDMVDLFTGDFTYNIPLFELPGPNGGYPFNLAYHAGIGLDQEASWCGLGWNLNPGAITRQMRGLPDEFKGDEVRTKTAIKPSITAGVGAGAGVELFGGAANLGLGLSVYHNNYRGVGYSIDGSAGAGKAFSSGLTAGVGLGFSVDSQQDGVDLSPSISLSAMNEAGSRIRSISLGAGYNSREGLRQLTLSTTREKRINFLGQEAISEAGQSSSTLTLASPGYTPQISMPMRNVNLSATFKVGASWWGVFGSPYVRGFFHEQWLKNNNKWVSNPAYGYLNYQHASADEGVMLDFNREKDGVIRKETPNLPIPSLTYDIYSVNGQGLNAMYRPFRSDVGTVHDPVVNTYSAGAAFGGDVAPALSHVGVNGSLNYGDSYSGPWRNNAPIADRFWFQKVSANDAYEPWYFKAHGESSTQSSSQYDALGKEEPMRVKLSGLRVDMKADPTLEGSTENRAAPNNQQHHRERTPRSQVITPVTNEELLSGTQEVLSAYKIGYLDADNQSRTLSRDQYPDHHLAGLTALTPEGLRYHYALPAYNHYQEDVQFSANGQAASGTRINVGKDGDNPSYEHKGTDEFLSRTELPAYVHAHLLTSIVGPDYVDVTGDGVTADDLGYWVKFTYQRATSDTDLYQWRAPFSKAIYQEGLRSTLQDDRGSFSYGKKDVWYLAQAETKSHIAKFITKDRKDSKGVANKLQDTNQKGKTLKALDQVMLYTRSAGSTAPLLKVKLQHEYSLCKMSPNSDAPGQGKLTLKKVWFEYGSSSRGSLNPYQFSYHGEDLNYNEGSYDRWGQFRPAPAGDPLYNQEFPYVAQDLTSSEKATLDAQASAWSLKEIKLPSGGQINVDYETDDYAYVQHRQAMQMMSLVNPEGAANESGTFEMSNTPRVRFKLKSTIDQELSAEQRKAEVLRYLEKDRPQVYFKLLVNLLEPSKDNHEFITGYADIDFGAEMGLAPEGGPYQYGYFHLQKEQGYHPFRLRAWQHVRTTQPELASPIGKMGHANSEKSRLSTIKALVPVFAKIRDVFTGFYTKCDEKKWGTEVVADKAWIRLCSPDKIKYGGGLRVKQITMQDKWADDQEGVYGQVYQYTMEEDGELISSGVAANEPMLGGDETALRYAKKYTQAVRLRSDNNLFFEYPINESYYPGPQVGYRKVSVKSLAAASLAGELPRDIKLSDGNSLFPKGSDVSYGTTGMTVHEFYTARDYPVIAEETDNNSKPYQLSVPIPFIGSVNISKLTASQGYSIQTNDMHGKPKRVGHHRQARDGAIDPSEISWVEYHYLQDSLFYDGQPVATLNNSFHDNGDQTVSVATNEAPVNALMGQENEFFMDMREHSDITWSGGANVNVDVIMVPVFFLLIPVPITTVWPMASNATQQLKTVVTNKVIFRRGILERVEAYNEGSLITTQHEKWDKLTGQPVLSTVNNNHNQPIYSYTKPAYHEYEGMGAAYQNMGMTLSVDLAPAGENLYQFTIPSPINDQHLFPGDEWILYRDQQAVGTAVYVGREDDVYLIHNTNNLEASTYTAKIVRSGWRNQLTATAGNIQALQDPTQEVNPFSYNRTITVPDNE